LGKGNTQFLQQRLDESVLLFEQRREKMLSIHLLIGMLLRNPLGGLQSGLSLDSESFSLHKNSRASLVVSLMRPIAHLIFYMQQDSRSCK
jgi:hypothetical protein